MPYNPQANYRGDMYLYNGISGLGEGLGAMIQSYSRKQQQQEDEAKSRSRLFKHVQGILEDGYGVPAYQTMDKSLDEVTGMLDGLREKQKIEQQQVSQDYTGQLVQNLRDQAGDRAAAMRSRQAFNTDLADLTAPDRGAAVAALTAPGVANLPSLETLQAMPDRAFTPRGITAENILALAARHNQLDPGNASELSALLKQANGGTADYGPPSAIELRNAPGIVALPKPGGGFTYMTLPGFGGSARAGSMANASASPDVQERDGRQFVQRNGQWYELRPASARPETPEQIAASKAAEKAQANVAAGQANLELLRNLKTQGKTLAKVPQTGEVQAGSGWWWGATTANELPIDEAIARQEAYVQGERGKLGPAIARGAPSAPPATAAPAAAAAATPDQNYQAALYQVQKLGPLSKASPQTLGFLKQNILALQTRYGLSREQMLQLLEAAGLPRATNAAPAAAGP